MGQVYCLPGTGKGGTNVLNKNVTNVPNTNVWVEACTDLLPGYYVTGAVAAGVDASLFIQLCPTVLAPDCTGVVGLFAGSSALTLWNTATFTSVGVVNTPDTNVTNAEFLAAFPAPVSVATGGLPNYSPPPSPPPPRALCVNICWGEAAANSLIV